MKRYEILCDRCGAELADDRVNIQYKEILKFRFLLRPGDGHSSPNTPTEVEYDLCVPCASGAKKLLSRFTKNKQPVEQKKRPAGLVDLVDLPWMPE